MALTAEQKSAIKTRAAQGETNAALAAEFSVSSSTISRIKSDDSIVINTTKKNKVGKVKEEKITKVEEQLKESVPTGKEKKVKKMPVAKIVKEDAKRVVIISSPERAQERFEVKAKTFGELLKEIGRNSGNIEAVFKRADKSRATLSNSKDLLPETGNEPLYLFLCPVKTDSGKEIN
jgi:hypothetical protein